MIYESSMAYHSKSMAIVQVFADKLTDRQTNGRREKWTGQKLYAPNLSMQGHKKVLYLLLNTICVVKLIVCPINGCRFEDETRFVQVWLFKVMLVQHIMLGHL